MTHFDGVKRRRLLIVWIAAVATCATAVSANLLLQPLHLRLVGLDLSTGLTGVTYLSATAMCATPVRWFRMAPRATRRITVQELRHQAADARSAQG